MHTKGEVMMTGMSEEALAMKHFGPKPEKLSDRINKHGKSQEIMGILGEVIHLEVTNAALLEMLNNLARWVGKGIADGAYSECVNSERAQVDLERATEAIRKGKSHADTLKGE